MLKLSENLDLPIDFVTERIAFLARTGAGKSGGMRVLFEQMHAAGQFCVFIDPKGDAWGIRADGIGKGKPVLIIGGDHADIPLEPTAGKYIADFLVRERVSTVLDMSDLSTQQMWTFVSDLGTRMYKLNRDVMHIFIDEADMIAGQQFFDPHCLHAIQLIQNKGRGRGFGMTIATQRPQILNKTVLNASGTLIAMQTIGDDALKVVKSWLGQTGSKETITAILGELPLLQNREAFVYSPQTLGIEPVRIRFATFQTFDSMRTPRPGEARSIPKSVADIDLSAIQRDMAETIEAAKAEDPKTLKKQIRDLEREINELRKGSNSEIREVEVVKEVPVLDLAALDAHQKLLNDELWKINSFPSELTELSDKMRRGFEEMGQAVKQSLDNLRLAAPKLSASNVVEKHARRPTQAAKPVETRPNVTDRPKSTTHLRSGANSDGKISGPQQKLLDTLWLFESMGVREVKRSNLAAFAGVSPRSSGFEKNLSTLKNHPDGPYVDYLPGSQVVLTEAGRILGNPPETTIASNRDLLDGWCRHISNPQAVLLRILFDQYPDSIGRAELANKSDVSVTSSGFEKNLSTLRSLGLIDYGPDRTVYATDLLFPFG